MTNTQVSRLKRSPSSIATCNPRVFPASSSQGPCCSRTTLQAWCAWQDRLDTCPYVVEFFENFSGLAFLHRLVLALHVVFVEIGAWDIRLVCLFFQMTGLRGYPET